MLPLPDPDDAAAHWTLWDTLEGRTVADLADVLSAARADATLAAGRHGATADTRTGAQS